MNARRHIHVRLLRPEAAREYVRGVRTGHHLDFAPSLSPDGQYLFFTRDEGDTGSVHWISAAGFRPSNN